jgi:uncharacterized protein YndB with AHSA1/START domain
MHDSPTIPGSTARTRIVPQGTVHAAVDLNIPVERCWDVITKPSEVGMWFGDLSGDLSREATARLDFKDGDFFAIREILAKRPTSVEYSWTFLGMGSSSRISWHVKPSPKGSTVELTDSSPSRSQSSAEELRDGWLDFFRRLESFVVTGKCTRYDFRNDFEGSIELEVDHATALRTLQARGGLISVANPVVEAAQYKVGAIRIESGSSLSFELSEPGWEKPTTCSIRLCDKGPSSNIAVAQSGWHDISSDSKYCLERRRFYSEKWMSALKGAKASIEQIQVAHSV